MEQVFTVTGMTCGHCEKAVSQSLQTLDPLAQVQINRTEQRVTVQSTLARDALRQAIEGEGYTVASA